MTDTMDVSVTDASMAYRLMLHSRLIEARNKGDKDAEKAAKAELDKDSAEISTGAKAAQASCSSSSCESSLDNVDIRFSDLVRQLHNVGDQSETTQTAQVFTFQETIETKASVTYYNLEKIDGLVVKNKNLAETDRYRFEFSDGSTFKIVDKWSNRSTTIWGDPHVDTSDEEGSNNGDFKDLKGSDQYTTFMLQDGTRVTFTAKDSGVIENVDIFKDGQHLSGVGSASKSWSEANGLFAKVVDDSAPSVSMGDVVYAGGDGNDWFNAARQLVWGKTTGPAVFSRPNKFIEIKYEQWVSQQFSAIQVDQDA